MPFGLKEAPATFQRLMIKVLGPYLYDFVMVYLDDIIIFSQTMDEHLQHIKKVLEALRQAGLKLKLEKCEFAKKQLKYLDFIVGEFEIKPDTEKVISRDDWVFQEPHPRILDYCRIYDKLVSKRSAVYMGTRAIAGFQK